MRFVRSRLRGLVAELSGAFPRALGTLAVIVALPLAVSAATPAPHPSPTPIRRIDLTKIQPKALLPKTALHTEFVVDTNKLGQVTRVVSGKLTKNKVFDEQTYGNALQAFIRTPDGRAVPGVYRLTYDYNPKTARVLRDVAIIHPGGVNPDAKGAAIDMISHVHPHAAPTPIPGSKLPDLNSVIHASPKPS